MSSSGDRVRIEEHKVDAEWSHCLRTFQAALADSTRRTAGRRSSDSAYLRTAMASFT